MSCDVHHTPESEPGCASCYESLYVDYQTTGDQLQAAEAEVQARRAELVKVYNEGADAIAKMVRRDERFREVLVEVIKHTASPLPLVLTMQIGDLLGVPGLRTTSARRDGDG